MHYDNNMWPIVLTTIFSQIIENFGQKFDQNLAQRQKSGLWGSKPNFFAVDSNYSEDYSQIELKYNWDIIIN